MPQFILTYHGGSQPASPAEGQAHMERYRAWMRTLDVVVGEQPLKGTQVLGKLPITPMIGYCVINAADMASAERTAAACPFLDMENSAMQVSELIVMG